MLQKRTFSTLQTVLLLGLVSAPTLTPLFLLAESAQAQTETASPAFPLPDALPANTQVRIDASGSMSTVNKALQDRFVQKYPSAKVTLEGRGTDASLAALEKGEIDLVAISRPLMPEETAKGLSEVPISREKIAIVVGANNPFSGNITFDQFAKIFRGEITDWSQLGGAPGPIRFIDRPETSDTRQAFRRYPVFQNAPFQVGTTAQPIAEDNTDAMVKALGKDGIGYATASQVLNREGIRILSMHKTLPDDPRYPFSQPRGYVYKGTPNIAVSSFLGFATAPEGQAAVKAAEATAAIAPGTIAAGNVPGATGGGASPAMALEDNGISWWPWLLGVPVAGGLLLWALKGRGKAATPVRPAETAAGRGETGAAGVSKLPQGGAVPFSGAATGAVAGATALGAGAAAAGLGASARSVVAGDQTQRSRVTLTPRDSKNAYVYWEAAEADKVSARNQGGKKLALRIYDVSSLSTQAFQEYDLDNQAQDRHVPIPTPNHDYRAELGYVAEDGRWIKVTQSAPVRVPGVSSASGVGDNILRTEKEAVDQASTGLGNAVSSVGDAATGAGAKAAGLGAAGLGAAVGLGKTVTGLSQKIGGAATPNEGTQIDPVDLPEGCKIAKLKVHSQRNCYVLDAKTIEQIQDKAVSQTLEPGKYLIKIQSGTFRYRSEPDSVGEPLVLLWIYGGKVVNQKTKVEVGSTWSSLNGYDDLLTLHVNEAATLSAFFFDTEVDDNQGEVTLSVIRI